jgi:hypothetical protein
MQSFENRSSLLIMPKEPFREWAKLYNEESQDVLDARLKEKHIYLVAYAYQEDLIDILRPYYVEILEYELNSWNYIRQEWPENRSLELFLDWFEVILCDDIFDLESEEIETEKV